MVDHWTERDIPDQRGRIVVITGANAGLGYQTAAALADKGAHVVLAVRNLDKGKEAAARIVGQNPDAEVALQRVDLSSLESVRIAARELRSAYPRIDVLINNAGIMLTPKTTTADGFELQFETNHLGHFALTGLLLDSLLDIEDSRIVVVSSVVHRIGAAIHFDDLQWERRYNRWAAYAQSKLANILFAYGLHRRLSTNRANPVAIAAHPGGCYGQQVHEAGGLIRPIARLLGPKLLQSPQMAALSPLRAATDRGAQGGQYYGPSGRGGVRGYPVLVSSSPQSHDVALQDRLWSVSEELTGVRFGI